MGEDLLSTSPTDDCEPDYCDPVQRLSLIERLESYADSELVYTRQLTARGVVRALQFVEDCSETQRLLAIIMRVADDPDLVVRADLLDNIPQIAQFCYNRSKLLEDASETPLSSFVLPFVLRFIKDTNTQVKKSSQAALVYLLEQHILNQEDVVSKLVPIVTNFAENHMPEDLRADAAHLICKMASVLGSDLTETYLLDSFLQLCTDSVFHVRKVCAVNIGDLCCIVGQRCTEEHLLAKFYTLCEDTIWGVRKSCCECFAQVSSVCSSSVRRTELSQLFINLIYDQSRWVRMSAFETLGSFIATFADPTITGLYLANDGSLNFLPSNDMYAKITNDTGAGEPDSCSAEKIAASSEEDESVDVSSLSVPVNKCDQPDVIIPVCSQDDADVSAVVDSSGTDQCCTCDSQSSQDCPSTEENDQVTLSLSSCNLQDEVTNEETNENIVVAAADVIDVDSGLSIEKRSEEVGCESCAVTSDQVSDCPLPDADDKDALDCEVQLSAESVVLDSDVKVADDSALESNNNVAEPLAEPAVLDVEISSSDSTAEQSTEQATETAVVDDNKISLEMFSSGLDCTGSEQSAVVCGSLELCCESDDCGTTSSHLRNEPVCMEARVSCAKPAETDAEKCANAVDLHDVYKDEDIAEDLRSNEADLVHIATFESAQCKDFVPSVPALVGSSDKFVAEDEENSHLKDVHLVCLENLDESTESGDDSTDEDDQNVVPRDLLNHYLGMMDPSCAMTVDNEVTRHCAYSLPAVAFTLGRRNWPALRNLYRALSTDVQWKVRRTLAFSIHELAVIVGEEVVIRDLVPVFDQFLNDLDEVRIGVLKHLADFMKLLPEDVRRGYLAKLTELLKLDNSHNWRFREELAIQLCLVVELYSQFEVSTYICPMAFVLADDKVAAVRHATVQLLASIVSHLDGNEELLTAYISELMKRYQLGSNFRQRQVFVYLCDCALQNGTIDDRSFTGNFLSFLLSMHADPVPNVRVALARVIARHSDHLERMCRECAMNPDSLDNVVNSLKNDADGDVRFAIGQAKMFSVINSDTA